MAKEVRPGLSDVLDAEIRREPERAEAVRPDLGLLDRMRPRVSGIETQKS